MLMHRGSGIKSEHFYSDCIKLNENNESENKLHKALYKEYDFVPRRLVLYTLHGAWCLVS